jgi:N6-L-threonylcarbamoyladenine synthase
VILGIETSCDETAAALVTADGEIVANVVASQAALHARYGGVVPEVASRRHLELIAPVVSEALDGAGASLADVESIAVTSHPGLIGALLVGVAAAKSLAWARRLPLAPVNHLHGHVASLYLKPLDLEPPFVCLLASGGHTMLLEVTDRAGYRVLGTTLDDAAGEAFDKGARLLGLGYPGGAALDALARQGDPGAYAFPVARVAGLDFSFSGVRRSSRRAGPTSQPHTSGRSSPRSWSAFARRERSASQSSVGWRRTASCELRSMTLPLPRSRCAPTTPR